MGALSVSQTRSTPVPAPPARAAVAHERATSCVRITPRYGTGPRDVEVRWSLLGPRDAPVVIVQGGISAGRDAWTAAGAGWWQRLVGPGASIDTERVRVLGMDWLEAGDLGVEVIGTEDQADVAAALLEQLGIKRVQAWIGASYGAMVGLAFASRHGRLLQRLVAIAGAHQPHPMASAQRAIQRGILEMGLAAGCEAQAVSLARQLGMTTYRGNKEFAERFSGPAHEVEGRWQLPVEAYLEHNGSKFARRFSARRYIALSQSIDLHRVDPATVTVPVSLIGIASDRLVPLADLCALQQALAGHASLDVIDSRCGHDGFLLEHARLAPLLAEALRVSAEAAATGDAPHVVWSA